MAPARKTRAQMNSPAQDGRCSRDRSSLTDFPLHAYGGLEVDRLWKSVCDDRGFQGHHGCPLHQGGFDFGLDDEPIREFHACSSHPSHLIVHSI